MENNLQKIVAFFLALKHSPLLLQLKTAHNSHLMLSIFKDCVKQHSGINSTNLTKVLHKYFIVQHLTYQGESVIEGILFDKKKECPLREAFPLYVFIL